MTGIREGWGFWGARGRGLAMAKVSFDRSIRDQTDRWMDRCGNIFIVPGLLLLCTKTMSRYVSIVLFNCQKKKYCSIYYC